MSDYDIIGIGGPILDQLLMVSHAFLERIPGERGGMEPVSYLALEKMISDSGELPVSVPGGCSRSIMHGLTKLGESCALLGMVGRDERGMRYRSFLRQYGIHPLLIESDKNSATVLSLVTPDGQRTMRTYQGASALLRGSHLSASLFNNVKHVHIEGYMLYNEDLIETAMRMAKEEGATISFDLASFEVVQQYRSEISYLLDHYIDVLFANEEEAAMLTEVTDEEEACDLIATSCDVAVVMMGINGCWVKQRGDAIHCSAYPVKPLDTTGAGDLFASGFLWGYVRGEPVDLCAHYGALTARAVVQSIGPVIPDDQWPALLEKLHQSDPATAMLAGRGAR